MCGSTGTSEEDVLHIDTFACVVLQTTEVTGGRDRTDGAEPGERNIHAQNQMTLTKVHRRDGGDTGAEKGRESTEGTKQGGIEPVGPHTTIPAVDASGLKYWFGDGREAGWTLKCRA
jgi:hypothetical protein